MKHMSMGRAAALLVATAAAGTMTAAPALSAVAAAPQAQSVTAVAKPKPHPLAEVTFIQDRAGGEQAQSPATFRLRKGTSGYLAGLKWTGWGAPLAQGKGRYIVKSVVGGKTRMTAYPVNVTASRLHKREATQVYTRLTVKFTAKPAPGLKKMIAYTLPR
ncbi:MAG: hypothetical protein IPM90_02935 [Austwickia sp.]|nr:hypothetical protein [Austwickia sp.]MBK9100524.1 hypothetical protein [Austwickia sp.]